MKLPARGEIYAYLSTYRDIHNAFFHQSANPTSSVSPIVVSGVLGDHFVLKSEDLPLHILGLFRVVTPQSPTSNPLSSIKRNGDEGKHADMSWIWPDLTGLDEEYPNMGRGWIPFIFGQSSLFASLSF